MVSYKLVNGRFELQNDSPIGHFTFDVAVTEGNEGSYYNLRDISPVVDNLVVVTSTDGLSIIYVKDGNFQTNNLIINEVQENVNTGNRFLYETSTTSQIDKFEGIISPRFLDKGIMIYNNIDLGLVSISSIETGFKLVNMTGPAVPAVPA
jgi:hypothetical protein